MATFESMDRRMPKIEACLKANGLESLDACNEMLLAKGIDCDKIVRGVQPICFDNAVWAYTLGTAIAVKRGLTDAAECAAAIGEGLEAFTIPGSVAEQRQVGLGHGNLGARLLSEDTTCFAFLAGHESFAAAEGAIGIARTANKVRKTPLRVILNGLGKDAAYIISRINGFTYVQTEYDIPHSDPDRRQGDPLLRGRARSRQVLRCKRRYGRRCHHEEGGRSVLHHRQLHQPRPLPASGCRHLQEVGHRERQEVLLCRFRRRHGPYPASR